jgi:RecA/RadA recombinase
MNVFKRHKYIDNIHHGSTGSHVTYAFIGDDWHCTCISYRVRKNCKHIKELFKEMCVFNIDEVINGDAGRKFSSCLPSINKLFGEEAYNTNEISGIYGKPKVGKSLMCIQEACKLSADGYNVMFVDTEGSIIPMLKQWVPVFEEKYGKRKGKILVESKKSIETLMKFLGHKVSLNYTQKKSGSGKGKLEFSVQQTIDSELENIIKKEKIDFVILDSLTSPLRSFTKEQQNYPARSDATAFIMRTFVRLQEEYNVGCLMTVHATFNPANPYETMAEATGGIVLHHYAKRLLYLDKRLSNAFRDYRRFWFVRGENGAEWSKASVAKIDDKGYSNITKKETVESVFTTTERGKIDISEIIE